MVLKSNYTSDFAMAAERRADTCNRWESEEYPGHSSQLGRHEVLTPSLGRPHTQTEFEASRQLGSEDSCFSCSQSHDLGGQPVKNIAG